MNCTHFLTFEYEPSWQHCQNNVHFQTRVPFIPFKCMTPFWWLLLLIITLMGDCFTAFNTSSVVINLQCTISIFVWKLKQQFSSSSLVSGVKRTWLFPLLGDPLRLWILDLDCKLDLLDFLRSSVPVCRDWVLFRQFKDVRCSHDSLELDAKKACKVKLNFLEHSKTVSKSQLFLQENV